MKLKSLLTEEIPGYSADTMRGLYRAKVGDFIQIGIEGSRVKYRSKIIKIVKNDKLQDENGNVFNRDGRIQVRKSSWVKAYGNKKIVSAKRITEDEYKKNILQFISSILQKYDYSKLHPEKLKELGKIIGMSFPQLNVF